MNPAKCPHNSGNSANCLTLAKLPLGPNLQGSQSPVGPPYVCTFCAYGQSIRKTP